MPNTISLFKKYSDQLDEVYRLASLTSFLDVTNWKAGVNANEVLIPKMTLSGLADYTRTGASGYVAGDVGITYETVKYNYDRGRKFNVDAMDNEETAGVAYGKLASEFESTMVVPELDAFRLATYATAGTLVDETLDTGAKAVTSIRAGITALNNAKVPANERYLFITSTLLGLIEDLDTTKSKKVLEKFANIIEVPQSMFFDVIQLNDGKASGQEAGGFEKATAGKDLNFLIVHKPAIIQTTKHVAADPILPSANPDADAYLFKYRRYGLADVYENKVAGIFGSRAGS